MILKKFGVILLAVFVVLVTVAEAQNWRGNTEPYKKWESNTCIRCICQYPTYCGAWRYFTCNVLVTKLRCLRGWTHNGNYNCNIPICKPNCGSVGVCVAPAKCDCKGQALGQYCQTLICSHTAPCYPGNCYSNNLCNCTSGFTKENSASQYGCLKIDTNNKPYIGKSTSVIEHSRKTDNKFLFYFLLDGTDETMSKLIVWSNQRVFNIMHFTFEVSYDPPEPLAERPIYVHKTKVGITEGKVLLRVLDYKNVEHPTQKYDIDCPASNPSNPQQLFNCTIENGEFRTLIDHADTLKVTFEARNGGYRQMSNQGSLLPEYTFIGQTSRKNVYFKFDFQAPKHCTEHDIGGYTAVDCDNSTMLQVPEEFTKEPITVRWKGWTDDRYGSQMWMYYLELHKLEVKDATLELTERNPIKPMARNQTLHMGDMSHYQTFTPLEPGMYSILLEVRDIANNSRIARRFVLYDKVSGVELNQESPNGLHVSSAQNHTGFKWQSAGSEGQSTNIVVNWAGYFMNKAHEDGHYNNEIQTFKPQFEDLEDDGILYTRKFVNASLDDMEGARTRDPIANIHGIVKFEYQFTRDIGSQMPGAVWTKVEPISETTTIKEQMRSGEQLKIRVRAQDVLGNTKMDTTIVTTDFTEPITSSADDNTTTYIVENTNVKPFNYSSSVYLEAYDTESGVRDIGVNITIKMQGVSNIYVSKMVKANTDDKRHPDRDSECVTSRDKTTCFLKKQTVIIDNCWLTVPNQALLPSASAIIDVIAYNQAMLPSSVRFEIPAITALDGLVSYNGPESARVENVKTESFRIVWDFPTNLSCYAIQTSIILVLFKKTSNGNIELETHVISGSNTYFDVVNLDADTEYLLDFITQIGDKKNQPMKLTARTYIDKCIANIDNCDDINGGCTNTAGSFTCSCNTGYNLEADGFTCTDIDECTANTDNCDNTNGGCTNTAGSFTCSCNTGYELKADGFTCTDIDECSTDKNICGPSDGLCTNTDGSYICSCNTGNILYNNSCAVPPGTPRSVTIDYIQYNKARLSWLPGNNGGLTQTFVIQLGTGERSWEDTEVQDEVYQNDKPMFKILTGLGDSTTYFVRMYAYNKVGKSPLSEILIFTTSPIKVETETTTTLIVGIVSSVVIVVVISYAIYVTLRLKRNISFKKGGQAQEKGDQVNIHIEDSTNIPDSGGFDNPYTDLKTEMRDSGSQYEAISTM